MEAKILVVDDEQPILNIVTDTLSSSGYAADTALDAASAIELLKNKHYHVVITDKNMPGTAHKNEGGLDVLCFAKEHNPACAVIILTGFATIESAIEAIRLGAFDYMNKPFSINDFNEKLERILKFQRTLNPQDTLSTYSLFRDGLFGFIEEIEKSGHPVNEATKKQLLNSFQENLDLLFEERKRREFVIIEQRDTLGDIAGLASHLKEIPPESEEAKKIIENIILKAGERP